MLDALLRHGISIPFSCRNGVCHVCMQRCIQGAIPPVAQRGLRRELLEQGCFLPCQCIPLTDMELVPPTELSELYAPALAGSADTIIPAAPQHADAQHAVRKYPPPDPGLWAALRHGELLSEVLQDFYSRVFQDERLNSFFHGVTMQRSIEKQYLFMRQILTGEKIYFGDRPHNAHHWMVISNELFDYRANIMLACLRKQGLSETMIQRFHEIEEFYRHDIVKSAPFARTMGDVEIPFEGFGEITMDVGTLCDSCGREVAVGEKVKYHVRLGKVYCADCSSQHGHD